MNQKNQCKLHLSIQSQPVPCGTKFKTASFPEKLGIFVNTCGEGFYSWCFWDIDAPSPDFLHWIVLNARPNDAGVDYLSYQSPAPPAGTGAHKYIIGLWKHRKPVVVPEKAISRRYGQNAREIMENLLQNVDYEWVGSSFILVEN